MNAKLEPVPGVRTWRTKKKEDKICTGLENIQLSEQERTHWSSNIIYTFSARRLSGGDVQNFGRHSHRSFDLKPLVLRSPNQIATNCPTIHPNYKLTLKLPNFVIDLKGKNERVLRERERPFSRFLTFFEESVILILWTSSWGSSSPGFVGFIAAYAILTTEMRRWWSDWRSSVLSESNDAEKP